MRRHILSGCMIVLFQLPFTSLTLGDDIFRETFDRPAHESPLIQTWGDEAAAIESNGVVAGIGVVGSSAARLKISYPSKLQHGLSYWTYHLSEPVPLVPQLERISFAAKSNVPISIKIGIKPFGFIYHGPSVKASDQWQEVTLTGAYEELKEWCANGGKSAENGWVSSIIVAVESQAGKTAEILIDDILLAGGTGAAKAVQAETSARRTRRVRVAAISLTWDEGHRTLEQTLRGLDEAGALGADLACLPQECVDQPAESIPGPASRAIARKAAAYNMYVVGNLREQAGKKTFVTSFLCDRDGEIVGTYRKSHRLPYEGQLELGDDLPVFSTDFGAIGMKIGTDHFFPEIDTVLRRRGASLVVWSTKPFPMRDEHYISYALRGRAVQNGLHYAVARYAGEQGYGGYADRFSWTTSWPLGRAQVLRHDGRSIADSGHGGGVSLAVIPRSELGGSPHPGGYAGSGAFAEITKSELLPAAQPDAKRVIRAAAIECEPDFERLMDKLDACGQENCDIVCLWEYVWYHSDQEVEKFRERNRARLARIAEAAKRHNMYVVIAGELVRGFNEAILYDREGHEAGRYTKIAQTTDKDSKYYQAGDRVGIFDLDFGRICIKICLDVSRHEIDRVAALHQADLMLLSTQDAGPYSEAIRLRDNHRCIDNGYYLLRAAGGGAECDHRTYIMDPWGMVLAASLYRVNNRPVVSTIDLDNRPQYHEWAEDVRKAGIYPDPVKRGIPHEQRAKMYGRFNPPVATGDLRSVILKCRRPALYQRTGGTIYRN